MDRESDGKKGIKNEGKVRRMNALDGKILWRHKLLWEDRWGRWRSAVREGEEGEVEAR